MLILVQLFIVFISPVCHGSQRKRKWTGSSRELGGLAVAVWYKHLAFLRHSMTEHIMFNLEKTMICGLVVTYCKLACKTMFKGKGCSLFQSRDVICLIFCCVRASLWATFEMVGRWVSLLVGILSLLVELSVTDLEDIYCISKRKSQAQYCAWSRTLIPK